MGAKDSLVDNVGAGGAIMHIEENGFLNNYATNGQGKRLYSPPAVPQLPFSEIEPVPDFNRIKEVVTQIAKNYVYFRILGFDNKEHVMIVIFALLCHTIVLNRKP